MIMIAHRLTWVALAVAMGAVLTGCGEKPQTASGIKSDQPPYTGTGGSPFAERGWTAGDKTAWAQHLRARAQYGQNEYSRPASAAQ
jgi:hypothetical protein